MYQVVLNSKVVESFEQEELAIKYCKKMIKKDSKPYLVYNMELIYSQEDFEQEELLARVAKDLSVLILNFDYLIGVGGKKLKALSKVKYADFNKEMIKLLKNKKKINYKNKHAKLMLSQAKRELIKCKNSLDVRFDNVHQLYSVAELLEIALEFEVGTELAAFSLIDELGFNQKQHLPKGVWVHYEKNH